MKTKLVIYTLVLLLMMLPLACAKPAPAPAPAPAPVPAPAPSPAPTPAPTPSTEKYTLTFAAAYGTSAPMLAFVPPDFWYATLVEEASNGRLVIDTKVDVLKDSEIAVAVSEGRFDMGRFYVPWVSGTFPTWDFASIPFFFVSLIDYMRAVTDPRLISILEKSYAEVGLVQLADAPSGNNPVIWSNKPLRTVDDFKGLKVRTAGITATYGMQQLGAAPLTIAAMELAEAMRMGTIDAVATDRIWAFTIGMTDVAKYLNKWGFLIPFPNVIVINKEKFDSLPADLQDILRNTSQGMAWQIAYAALFGGQFAEKAIGMVGVEIIEPDKAEIAKARALATESTAKKWLEMAGPYGPEILEIISDYGSLK